MAHSQSAMSPGPKMAFRSWGGRRDPSTSRLRSEFLRAVDEVAPHLASEMIETVGPVFEQLAKRSTDGDLRAFAWIAREERDFLAAWRAWAEQYGLHRDRWILDHAASLMAAVLSKDPSRAHPELRRFTAVPLQSAHLPPGHQIPPPDPFRPDEETRAAYEKRIGAYVASVKAVARSLGWEPAPTRPDERLHLQWLARFLVNGETAGAIAHSAGTDRRNVERALEKMADSIGLTRRTVS